MLKPNYIYKVQIDDDYEIVLVNEIQSRGITERNYEIRAETLVFLYNISESSANDLRIWEMIISETEMEKWKEIGVKDDYPEYFI